MMTTRVQDPYDLDRFVQAQAANYDAALAELRAGRKRTHWSWYVLPQVQGLGSSPMSVMKRLGNGAFVTLRQVAPASLPASVVTCTLPSEVPAQTTSPGGSLPCAGFKRGCAAMAVR